MCDSPIMIKNLNNGLHNKDPVLSFIKDTKSDYIPVGCGHCPSCLALKQEYFIQRFQMETLDNDLWTGMLSYNNQALPTVVVNGYKHKFADTRDVQLLIKRLRNIDLFTGPFKYWFISERGGLYHRPHWHFLISTPKIPNELFASKLSREKIYFDAILDNWYTNYGSRRKPIKIPNLTYVFKNGRYNYDFHYVNPSLTKDGQTDVAFYTSKYYLKEDDYTKRLRSALRLNIKDDNTFKYYWSLLKHKSLQSHYLGDYRSKSVSDYINFCVDFSLQSHSPYPLFLNPETSQTFPLSPYYRNKFITPGIGYQFALNQSDRIDGVMIRKDVDLSVLQRKYEKFNKILERINLRDLDYQLLQSNEYSKFDNITELDFVDSSEAFMGQSSNDFSDFTDFDDFPY